MGCLFLTRRLWTWSHVPTYIIDQENVINMAFILYVSLNSFFIHMQFSSDGTGSSGNWLKITVVFFDESCRFMSEYEFIVIQFFTVMTHILH